MEQEPLGAFDSVMLCAVHIDVGDREDGLCFIAQVLHRGAASRVCSELASENSCSTLTCEVTSSVFPGRSAYLRCVIPHAQVALNQL